MISSRAGVRRLSIYTVAPPRRDGGTVAEGPMAVEARHCDASITSNNQLPGPLVIEWE
jgi:hypothetical protein